MTKIQWTDQAQNPIKEAKEVNGQLIKNGNYCIPISPGCKNCYASTLNARGARFGGNGRKFGERAEGYPLMFLDIPMLLKWARIRKPRKIFVGSMTDWGGEWVKDWMIFEMLDAMANSRATFQLLSKRPERIMPIVEQWVHSQRHPAPNIWIGTSAENQVTFDERLPWLIKTPAAVRFLSLEPLLAPVELAPPRPGVGTLAKPYIKLIDWVIVGGESGPNARPLELDWIAGISAQCKCYQIPLFVKQLGSHWAKRAGAKDKKGGDPDEWPADLRVRMFPGETWE